MWITRSAYRRWRYLRRSRLFPASVVRCGAGDGGAIAAYFGEALEGRKETGHEGKMYWARCESH